MAITMEHKCNQYNERLRQDGFRIFRLEDEEYLFYRVGRTFLWELYLVAFEYSCLEAEYLRLPKQGKPFKELNEINRTLIIHDISDKIEQMDKQNGHVNGTFGFNPASSEEMKEDIKQKYENERKSRPRKPRR